MTHEARMEPAEVSAAKDLVMIELPDEVEEPISVADTIIEALLDAGVLIPEWIRGLDGKPAQGYHPTGEQIAAWEGRRNG